MLVERAQDFLAVEAERIEQRRHRNLAAAVDARIDDVLGVELDVEPGTAVRDNAGGEQQLARRVRLALVVIEEHAGRTVHLRNDDALGAVDDEGAVVGHERNVAHVDILLLDVLDRTRGGFLVDIEHDQPQRHLERRGIGHTALAALVDVVFRRFEFVFDEFEHGRIGKIGNREHRFEHRLQALVGTPAHGFLDQQELVIRCLLNLDEVRHLRYFFDCSEKLPYALATGKCLRHRIFLSIRFWRPARAPLRTVAIHRDHQDRRRGYPFLCDSGLARTAAHFTIPVNGPHPFRSRLQSDRLTVAAYLFPDTPINAGGIGMS